MPPKRKANNSPIPSTSAKRPDTSTPASVYTGVSVCRSSKGVILSDIDKNISIANYKISASFKKIAEEKKILINVDLTSLYNFNEKIEIEIQVKNGDEEIDSKDFEIKKRRQSQTFAIDLGKKITDDDIFTNLEVIAKLTFNPSNIIRTSCGTETILTNVSNPHDVVLIVGETKFYVLKTYLAVWSRFFDRLFFGDFAENDKDEITIYNVEPAEFEMLLKIIYPSQFVRVGDNNVLFLLQLADRFDMPSVMAMCGAFLCNNENLPELTLMYRLELADKHNLVDLQINCFESFHAMSGAGQKKFHEENRDRLQELSYNTMKNLM